MNLPFPRWTKGGDVTSQSSLYHLSLLKCQKRSETSTIHIMAIGMKSSTVPHPGSLQYPKHILSSVRRNETQNERYHSPSAQRHVQSQSQRQSQKNVTGQVHYTEDWRKGWWRQTFIPQHFHCGSDRSDQTSLFSNFQSSLNFKFFTFFKDSAEVNFNFAILLIHLIYEGQG